MKPGIPWSVKGIEQQARAAAKEAARQQGMTIGEWLNSVILESAEGGDDLERRYRRAPYRPKPLPGAEQAEGEEAMLRLEEIAEQLHTIARHESDTALPRHPSPEDEAALRAIVERLDAHEQQTTSVLGAMQERLDEISQGLARRPEHDGPEHDGAESGAQPALPQRAEDVPGYRALEGALRNIIEHIEISETRTRESIRTLHERLAERMEHSGEAAGAAAVETLEQRVAELAERLAGADAAAPNDLDEVRQTEQRLRSLVEEARQASGPLDTSALQGDIDSLNQRFDDMKSEAVSERDIDQLRLEIEQLAATVSQASGHALSDLGTRVEQLEAELRSQFSERDQATQREVAALAERIAATEKRLEHLATIEESVAQLTRSLETDRGGNSDGGASPEIKALEDGLKAVRASAEVSDRRTQETLHAVHETLEYIVGKLADLESDGDDAGDDGGDEPSEARAEEPAEDASQDVAASSEAEPETTAAAAIEEADETATMDSGAVGFDLPEAPTADDQSESPDEPQAETAEPPSEPHAPTESTDAPAREDYIAAARRAAQMAATRRQNPMTSGFNRFSQRLSGGAANADEGAEASPQKRGFASTMFGGLLGRKAKAGGDGEPAGKKSKRKRLIFAGLVLLVAASAYGAQRHAGSLADLDLLGDKRSGVDAGPEEAGTPVAPQSRRGTPAGDPARSGFANARDVLTTASIAPASGASAKPGRMAPETPAAATPPAETLPDEVGPQSLRQAALAGDAVAQFVVGGRYLEGKAVARNEEQAAKWYTRAATQGLAAAQYRLGSMYEHGRGVALDRKQALAWYEKAAARGNINAMHNLAVLQVDGVSGSRNYDQAAEWFRKAAERGLKDSQFNLAVLHEKGLGIPKSPERAVFWYSLAAVQGDSEAATKAKALEAALAPETAKQVHARLLEWRALPADRNANAVSVGDPSWLEMS